MSTKAKRLAAYVAGYGVRAFDWGTANCCHFTAGWVRVVEGVDFWEGLPATPTERAARRLISRLGGMAAVWTRQLGREAIPTAMAQVGDVVLLDVEGRPVLGICNGAVVIVVLDNGTMAFLSMDQATHAWRLSC